MPSIKASVAQCCTVFNDTPATIEKLRRLAGVAVQRDQSQLVVFPEALIGGYPKFSSFGTAVGTRSLEGRHEFVKYYKNAISVPSKEIDEVATIARDLNIFIVTGFIEQDGGTLYCSVGFFEPKRGLLYRRRKLMPTGSERLIWGFGDKEDVQVVKSTFTTSASGSGSSKEQTSAEEELTISGTICWENFMKDYPADYNIGEGSSRDPEGVMSAGGSLIVSPLGEVLAGPLRGEEGVLTAALELDDVLAGKYDLDVCGHYSRKDLFQLHVRT